MASPSGALVVTTTSTTTTSTTTTKAVRNAPSFAHRMHFFGRFVCHSRQAFILLFIVSRVVCCFWQGRKIKQNGIKQNPNKLYKIITETEPSCHSHKHDYHQHHPHHHDHLNSRLVSPALSLVTCLSLLAP